MSKRLYVLPGSVGLSVLLLAANILPGDEKSLHPEPEKAIPEYEWQPVNESWKMPFAEEQPITFVNQGERPDEWARLPAFWNETTEKALDPGTGLEVTRKAVVIQVPLGLSANPPIPAENPLTVQKWALGKKLYFDPVLSSDASVSCASCHDPKRGYTDHSPFSLGIGGQRGGVSAPTVFNTAYNPLQFWDGRAASLEDQCQGPPQNPVEMFDGKGHAWNRVVERLRKRPEYVEAFKEVFGTLPTRDAAAKAIASYERTVLSGNSLYDRAQLALLYRAAEEEVLDPTIDAKDYARVLNEAFRDKDGHALQALGLDPARDAAKVPAVAKSLADGQQAFFGNKAGCSNCHAGYNFTDNLFHNLGVGVVDGKLPEGSLGRVAAQPPGHKDPEAVGAFKTPTLRHLVGTAPYMHDGSEDTLEKVVEFYDKGGNANRHLSPKMRDTAAEMAYARSKRERQPYEGPEVKLFGPDQVAIVPKKLGLTDQEKKDLVLFMRALQGDPADPVVADPNRYPR